MQSRVFPAVEDLPVQKELPDPFLRPDGKRITSPREWKSLREHWLALVLHYEYGELPPKPRGVRAETVEEQEVPDLKACAPNIACISMPLSL